MAIALVSNLGQDLGGTGGTSSAIDTTGADLIVIGISYYGGITPSVSDSQGNTWVGLTAAGGSASRTVMYYAKNATANASHTFTVTGGDGVSTGFISICVEAFSGSDTTSPFDQENASSVGSGTTVKPGSVTPTANDEVVVTTLTFYPGSTTSVDSGFTKTNYVNYTNGAGMGSSMAYLIQTTAAAADPEWTTSNSSTQICAVIASFKAAGGGGGGALPKIIQTLQAPIRASFF